MMMLLKANCSIAELNRPNGYFGYSYNYIANGREREKYNNDYFNQLIGDSVKTIKHGNLAYVFTLEQINEITLRMTRYKITYENSDGIYIVKGVKLYGKY